MTLFEEKRSKTFLSDFSGMHGFLLQYSSNKRGEFYPTWQIAESTDIWRQESCFSFPFSFALLVNFSSRYWKLTEQKERWAWIHKKWGFDLKEVKNQRVGSTHITRSGEVMSHIMSNNDTSEKKNNFKKCLLDIKSRGMFATASKRSFILNYFYVQDFQIIYRASA